MNQSDITFAQKATAIVRAAGLDPKSMDLETFRRLAPIIFIKAFSAIYKENVLSLSSLSSLESISREEQILSIQIIIDSLTTKVQHPSLATFSGIDIFQGNHRAIGILVNILYAEGQRMWLEKSKKFVNNSTNEQNSEISSLGNKSNDEDIEAVSIESSKKSRSNVSKKIVDDNNSGLSLQENYFENETNNDEVNTLLNRIEYLEKCLKKKNKKKDKQNSNHDQRPLTSRSDGTIKKSKKDKEYEESDKDVLDDHKKNFINNTYLSSQEDSNDFSSGRVRRKRPSSAPSTRKVSEVSARLYTVKPKEEKEKVLERDSKGKNDNIASSLYTYNPESGRRILKVEFEEYLKKKKKESEILNNYDQFFNSDKEKGKTNISKPIRSEFPGKRIEKSVVDYVFKMNQIREPVDESKVTMTPQKFSIYNHLKPLDLLISIEFCHNCHHHNVSLRHDADEYLKNCNNFLVFISNFCYLNFYNVRLGVSAFKANITSNCKVTDKNSRIGALEIQIAYKNKNNELYYDLIHSKIVSRRWPSKILLEKKLKSFFSTCNIPTYNPFDLNDANFDMINGYPSGHCSWDQIALSNPLWTYDLSNSIEWVYDTKSIVTLPKFNTNDEIWVNNIIYKRNIKESYPLKAIVRRYDESSNSKKLYVSLKYHQGEILVPESDCLALDNFKFSMEDYINAENNNKLPHDLEGFFLLCAQEKLLNYRIMNKKEDENKYHLGFFLSRASCFHQFREMAYTLIEKKIFHHPLTNKKIDLFIIYTEVVLDYLFYNVKGSLSMLNIEKRAGVSSLISTMSDKSKNNLSSVSSPKPPNEPKSSLTPTRRNISSPFEHNLNENITIDPQPQSSSKITSSASISKSTFSDDEKPSIPIIKNIINEIINSLNLKEPFLFDITLSQTQNFILNLKSVSNSEILQLTDLILLLHRIGLSNIADNSQHIIKLSSYFSLNPPTNSQLNLLDIISLIESCSEELKSKSITLENEKNKECNEVSIESIVNSNEFNPPNEINIELSNDKVIHNNIINNNIEFDNTSRNIESVVNNNAITTDSLINSTNEIENKDKSNTKLGVLDTKASIFSYSFSNLITQFEDPPNNFNNCDLTISSIILEGNVLCNKNYDSLFVKLFFPNQINESKSCLSREIGSKRRTYNVNWNNVSLSSSSFREKYLVFSILISDSKILDSVGELAFIKNTEEFITQKDLVNKKYENVVQPFYPFNINTQTNLIQVPLYLLMKQSFELTFLINLPVFDSPSLITPSSTSSSTTAQFPPSSVKIIITGHSHEDKFTRQTRIMSMKPTDLLNLKFDPLPTTLDESSESDLELDIDDL